MHSRGGRGSSRLLGPEPPDPHALRTHYLVLWWMSQSPCAAMLENEEAAAATAKVRNGLVVAISGHGIQVDSVTDWFRRDEEGRPMPAEWRALVGHGRVPWRSPVPEETEVAGTA